MASNNKTLIDPDEPGETPDWFELYNPGPGAVVLDGLGLADGEPLESGFAITSGLTIPAGGFLVFYADNDVVAGAAAHQLRAERRRRICNPVQRDHEADHRQD